MAEAKSTGGGDVHDWGPLVDDLTARRERAEGMGGEQFVERNAGARSQAELAEASNRLNAHYAGLTLEAVRERMARLLVSTTRIFLTPRASASRVLAEPRGRGFCWLSWGFQPARWMISNVAGMRPSLRP